VRRRCAGKANVNKSRKLIERPKFKASRISKRAFRLFLLGSETQILQSTKLRALRNALGARSRAGDSTEVLPFPQVGRTADCLRHSSS